MVVATSAAVAVTIVGVCVLEGGGLEVVDGLPRIRWRNQF